MKTGWIVFKILALTVLVVAGVAGTGWWLIGRDIWDGSVLVQGCTGGGQAARNGSPISRIIALGSTAACPGTPVSISVRPANIGQAKEVVEKYVVTLGYSNLRVDEVIEFSQNYDALVSERDTGRGAVEVLIDKGSGAVGPSYGPNMLWNARYGMHRGGMICSSVSGKMTVTPEDARRIAQRWLDAYRPGQTPEAEPDAFYGYYTIHTLQDGRISGMLSVHGATGQVWYHSWHGNFVQMIADDLKPTPQ